MVGLGPRSGCPCIPVGAATRTETRGRSWQVGTDVSRCWQVRLDCFRGHRRHTGPDHRCGPDVLEGHRADLPGQVPGMPSAEFDRADVAHHVRGSAAVGALDQERVSQRQMPPWHIDPSVGVQKFKNDMSLSQKQIDTIVAWVDAGAPQGDPKDLPPAKPISADNEWKGVKDGFGKPDLVIRSSEYKMPARRPGRVVPADERHPDHRAALGEDGRDSSDQPEGPQGRASLDRVSRAEPDNVAGREHRHRQRPVGAAIARRPRQSPPAADGMGDRQGLRPVHAKAPAS